MKQSILPACILNLETDASNPFCCDEAPEDQWKKLEEITRECFDSFRHVFWARGVHRVFLVVCIGIGVINGVHMANQTEHKMGTTMLHGFVT